MGKMKDITGQRFGRLVVIDCAGKLNGRQYYWNCQCDCGNTKTIAGTALRSGNTTSCGCKTKEALKKRNEEQTKKTLIPNGTKMGKLTIIEPVGYKPQYEGATKNRMWYKCLCDCGKYCEVSGNRLKTNHNISCGCVSSVGEHTIEQLLIDNNIIYNKEVVLPELLAETGRRLRFDFVIYNNSGQILRIIEFDGRQHFQGPDTNYWGHSTDTLESIQEKDSLKNNFCKKYNYPLIRIPYTKKNNITLDDLLGDKYLI